MIGLNNMSLVSENPWIGISIFFLLLLIGLVAVSIHYRNKYEELVSLYKENIDLNSSMYKE